MSRAHLGRTQGDIEFVYQGGPETITGFQLPVNAMLRAGEALKVSADLGLYSGDDFSVKPSKALSTWARRS